MYRHVSTIVRLLQSRGYRREHKSTNYKKHWVSNYSACAFMVDVFELSLLQGDIYVEYLNHLERKAERVLAEMDS